MFLPERKSAYVQVEEDARRLLNSISSALRDMGSSAHHELDKTRVLTAEKSKEVEALAREHVWATAAVAAVVGVVMGSLFSRRR